MRKIFLSNLLILTCFACFCQVKKRVSRSRLLKDNVSVLNIKAGDILIYEANQDGLEYEIRATVQEYGNSIKLNYNVPKRKKTAKLVIPASAVKSAQIYDPLLRLNNKSFKSTNVFWLSRKNYKELSDIEETEIDLGAGKELFKKARVNIQRVKYKGKEKTIAVTTAENSDPSSKKSFLVLNQEKNPLLIKIESGWLLTLREVR